MKSLQNLIDGEWIFAHMPNGGTAVFLRTLQLSVTTFLVAIGFESYLAPTSRLTFEWDLFLASIRSHLPWFGVIFGGVYAALYSRFSSQWTYLAGLYNSLMQLECEAPRSTLAPDYLKRRAMCWAAFVEDACVMHLATKPSLSFAVLGLLREPAVRAELDDWQSQGSQEIAELEKRLNLLLPGK